MEHRSNPVPPLARAEQSTTSPSPSETCHDHVLAQPMVRHHHTRRSTRLCGITAEPPGRRGSQRRSGPPTAWAAPPPDTRRPRPQSTDSLGGKGASLDLLWWICLWTLCTSGDWPVAPLKDQAQTRRKKVREKKEIGSSRST